MAAVRKKLCPASRYYLKCPYTRTPTRIVVHNTANDAPAENEVSYMLNRPEEVSFHYAVDDQEAVQGLPLDRNAWASGDGHDVGNMEGIHIEICYSLSGGPKFTVAERNAAELIASLLKQYGWGMEKVTKHQDYDGKYCPHRTLDLGWGRFLNMVKEYLNEKKEDDDMTEAQVRKIAQEVLTKKNPVYNTVADVPDYWRDAVQELVDLGCIRGTSMNPDGSIKNLGMTKSEVKAAVVCLRMIRLLVGKQYTTFDELPEWAKPYIQQLLDRGTLEGVEVNPDGTRVLSLSTIMLRLAKMLADEPIEEAE